MPPPFLADLDKLDLDQTVLTQEQIYEYLPHRAEFSLLQRVCHLDHAEHVVVACCEVTPDAWWFKGHIPGRPLVPGVLMLEMAGQACGLLAKLTGGYDAFIALGGVDQCKFREAVTAPSTLYLIGRATELRPRRIISATQGVVNGRLVFEALITGLPMR